MPKNDDAYQVNSKIISMILRETIQYYATDEIRIGDNVQHENYLLALELLQTLHFSSIPQHCLKLKVAVVGTQKK